MSGPAHPQQGKGHLPTMSSIEDDDEFEDFSVEDWTEADEDREDSELWQDNWDDEDLDDEFSRQLRIGFAAS
ncbi:hypothetical protein HK104_009021 [Borealophlyctis nickersoniae]|nr:hypothetical protein HK104_009021 [Borealophlyctis nickersoniae]